MDVASGIIGVASVGIKLSTTLYTFASSVANADRDMTDIAGDIALTSNVLNNVGSFLKDPETSTITSETAITDATSILSRCHDTFGEIQVIIDKNSKSMENGTKKYSNRTKFMWPLKSSRAELLKKRLESLKSSLMLLLQVLSLARDRAQGKLAGQDLIYQRENIVNLHRRQQDAFVSVAKLESSLEMTTIGDSSYEQSRPFTNGSQRSSFGRFLLTSELSQSTSVSTKAQHSVSSGDIYQPKNEDLELDLAQLTSLKKHTLQLLRSFQEVEAVMEGGRLSPRSAGRQLMGEYRKFTQSAERIFGTDKINEQLQDHRQSQRNLLETQFHDSQPAAKRLPMDQNDEFISPPLSLREWALLAEEEQDNRYWREQSRLPPLPTRIYDIPLLPLSNPTEDKGTHENGSDPINLENPLSKINHDELRFLVSEFARRDNDNIAYYEKIARVITGLPVEQLEAWFRNWSAEMRCQRDLDKSDKTITTGSLPNHHAGSRISHVRTSTDETVMLPSGHSIRPIHLITPRPFPSPPPVQHYSEIPPGNHATQDYQMQLMLLEQQNKKRLLMARQEPINQSKHHFNEQTSISKMPAQPNCGSVDCPPNPSNMSCCSTPGICEERLHAAFMRDRSETQLSESLNVEPKAHYRPQRCVALQHQMPQHRPQEIQQGMPGQQQKIQQQWQQVPILQQEHTQKPLRPVQQQAQQTQSHFSLDFAVDSTEVLENFDFDSFLHENGDDAAVSYRRAVSGGRGPNRLPTPLNPTSPKKLEHGPGTSSSPENLGFASVQSMKRKREPGCGEERTDVLGQDRIGPPSGVSRKFTRKRLCMSPPKSNSVEIAGSDRSWLSLDELFSAQSAVHDSDIVSDLLARWTT